MAKRNIRILAVILVLAMTAALLPVTAAAAETTDTWNVSKSKTATALTNNNQTTVTLSLPSAEKTLASDIVFVLDKSSCRADTAKKAWELFTALKDSLKDRSASVKVGIIAFDGTSHTLSELVDYKGTQEQIEELGGKIASGITAGKLHGTNMQAGLMAAEKMLQADDQVPSENKHVVLISDGLTRLFVGFDGRVKDIYYQYSYSNIYPPLEEVNSKGYDYFGMMGEWDQIRNGIASQTESYQVPYGSWDKYFAQVTEWVKADGDTYAMDFLTYGGAVNPGDATAIVKNTDGTMKDTAFKYIGHLDAADHAMAVDRAIYEAYNEYQKLVNAGYRCSAVNVGTSDMSSAFMGALNKLSGNSGTVDFDSVKDEILYALDSGTVTDVIGSNFDLVTSGTTCPFTLTVDGVSQTSAAGSTSNTWNFGVAKNNVYPYTITYTPGTNEQFVWTINVPVENLAQVQLSYTLNLVNRSTSTGTHTVPTNDSTKLEFYSSKDSTKKYDDFTSPTVSYTVGGYNHYDDQTIPDTVPTGLNGIDHIAYIIGRQGYARPNATITRAEVAAIFFRLLTDEMRESHLTSTNDFTDVKAGSWYNTAVSTLVDMGILKGYPDGTFRPDASITRAEFAAIAARFDSTDITGKTATFTDIATSWAKADIERTAILGWVEGYPDGSFRPDSSITRAEAVTLVNRVLQRVPGKTEDLLDDMVKWPDNADTTAWYYLAIQEASNSHDYEKYTAADKTTEYEKWTELTTNPDWVKYQK